MVAASLARAVAAAALTLTSDLGAILVVSSLLTAGNAFGQPVELALIAAVAEATGVHEAPVRGPCRGPGAGHTPCRGGPTAGAARQRRTLPQITSTIADDIDGETAARTTPTDPRSQRTGQVAGAATYTNGLAAHKNVSAYPTAFSQSPVPEPPRRYAPRRTDQATTPTAFSYRYTNPRDVTAAVIWISRTSMAVRAIQTGRLTANETLWRSGSLGSLLRRKEEIAFPGTFFVLERSEGLVAIDTGIDSRARSPRALHRIVPKPSAGPQDEAGPRMASAGLEAAEIETVLATHLDWDHIGGVRHFPKASVHVHREDHKWATSFRAKGRTLPKLWPESFKPRLFELDPEPYGPFASSATVPGLDGIRIVPLPGHTPGQVGVVVDDDDRRLFFCGDHMLRVDWFEENFAAGRKRALLEFRGKTGTDTSERVRALAEEPDVVMIPSHDPDAHRAAGFTVI